MLGHPTTSHQSSVIVTRHSPASNLHTPDRHTPNGRIPTHRSAIHTGCGLVSITLTRCVGMCVFYYNHMFIFFASFFLFTVILILLLHDERSRWRHSNTFLNEISNDDEDDKTRNRKREKRGGTMRVETFESSSSSSVSRVGRRRVGLVIAHPDDESMFFLPTIFHLRRLNHIDLYLLCLSNGNADGFGQKRHEELLKVGRMLQFDRDDITIIEDERHLKDGMKERWNIEEVERRVKEFVKEREIDTLLTFDVDGVSSHPNHIATYLGVRQYIRHQKEEKKDVDPQNLRKKQSSNSTQHTPTMVGYALLSTPIWRKYIGIFDCLLSWCEEVYHRRRRDMVSASRPTTDEVSSSSQVRQHEFHSIHSFQPWLNYACMEAHASQFVWYRRLFVVLSRYTYVNTIERIE